ncbi:Crp/Fnr family transcriptional regulator [Hyphobacterium marinum]|uniref:Crp/Fnr family transcriptional regulator n=1 Tax=Hyphobacterium marinum TaxID=3116574 RepID=A0ABU7M1Y8_9PROT|nr:Crp/Fnr family transcriptional regulator [Hyphobacterium sp. Y6023]MEE2567706.1 Crp/Fnr family transcriptional regulator [Hyphobacterium sp. Y6023]
MDAFFNRLEHYARLSAPARSRIENAVHQTRHYQPRTALIRQGDRLGRIFVLEQGWAIRKKELEDGRRQILNFLVPGDIFDLQALINSPADHGVETITPCQVRSFETAAFIDAAGTDFTILSSLWWATVQEEAILREQIVRVGRMTAIERIAHLILELQRRTRIAGLGHARGGAALPITRGQIADALGLSPVHVSRTITVMRRMGLIATDHVLEILDPESLVSVAGFDDHYLHLDASPLPADLFSRQKPMTAGL